MAALDIWRQPFRLRECREVILPMEAAPSSDRAQQLLQFRWRRLCSPDRLESDTPAAASEKSHGLAPACLGSAGGKGSAALSGLKAHACRSQQRGAEDVYME